jgi:glycerol-3-phosphate O-acyltransferase
MYNQGIHINEEEFLRVKKWALYAEEKKVSLIFLPSHKSHIDYLVISYVFFRLGIALPHIAAGENLNIPLIGNLLKACGAFFIRRSWNKETGDTPIYF